MTRVFPNRSDSFSFKDVKTIVCTTPIRPIPTDFYPMASMLIVGALRSAGWENTHLYNIDLKRPSFKEVIEHFVRERPAVIGISAVVSTAYDYVKKLTLELNSVLPNTLIVLGGNLGASAEIVLRRTGVDFVCTGEGEIAIVEFMKQFETAKNYSDFKDVLGFAFIDENDSFVFTGYPEPLSANAIFNVDWSILEENNELNYFLQPMANKVIGMTYNIDQRLLDERLSGKNFMILVASKGCVARCTFCHRWDKGIRYIPVPILMERVDKLINKYNVGFISFGDENFGTAKKWLAEFLEEIKKRNILWKVSGMRVNCITEEWMLRMKDAGCVQILYGMESGSPKILKVMEKMTTLEQNKATLALMIKHKMPTTVQLVLGMPGESPETMRETADFASYPATLSKDWDPNSLSVNYAQALPGTPLYEHARRKGYIGKTVDDEEDYLLLISDRDARDGETTINFTGYPRLEYDCWHQYLQLKARVTYIKSWGLENYKKVLLNSPRFRPLLKKNANTLGAQNGDTGYFAEPARSNETVNDSLLQKKKINIISSDTASNIKEEIIEIDTYPSLCHLIKKKQFGQVSVFYPRLVWNFRSLLWLMTIITGFKKYGRSKTMSIAKEYLLWRVKRFFNFDKVIGSFPAESIRKQLKKDVEGVIKSDPEGMKIIRLGR